MEYKGVIKAGKIEAEFLSDYSNEDPDLITIGFSGSGTVLHDRKEAVPGGIAKVGLQVDQEGMLQVMVATGHASDSGKLTVKSGGTVKTAGAISGSAHWVYSVGV